MFFFCVLKVTAEIGKLLGEEKVDAILCVAGGWAGGSAKAKCKPVRASLYRNEIPEELLKIVAIKVFEIVFLLESGGGC